MAFGAAGLWRLKPFPAFAKVLGHGMQQLLVDDAWNSFGLIGFRPGPQSTQHSGLSPKAMGLWSIVFVTLEVKVYSKATSMLEAGSNLLGFRVPV